MLISRDVENNLLCLSNNGWYMQVSIYTILCPYSIEVRPCVKKKVVKKSLLNIIVPI